MTSAFFGAPNLAVIAFVHHRDASVRMEVAWRSMIDDAAHGRFTPKTEIKWRETNDNSFELYIDEDT